MRVGVKHILAPAWPQTRGGAFTLLQSIMCIGLPGGSEVTVQVSTLFANAVTGSSHRTVDRGGYES